MFSCTMELPNESVSLDVIFVLFCFHLGQVCDLMFSPKIPEKLLFIFIRGIQQATSISFFFFLFWESTRESKENTFCTLW